jgi:hypothetical protein
MSHQRLWGIFPTIGLLYYLLPRRQKIVHTTQSQPDETPEHQEQDSQDQALPLLTTHPCVSSPPVHLPRCARFRLWKYVLLEKEAKAEYHINILFIKPHKCKRR